jgi:NAD(P)-dependent dehydrogenase (short-subunit alcohol dehydrogenase family)
MKNISLAGRAAVITGASQGLGLAIARAFVSAGASILICARDKTELAKAREEISLLAGPGQIVTSQVADVSCRADVDRLFETAFSVFSRLHILVNNAGVSGPKGVIDEIDWDKWVHAIEINLFGSIHCCRAVLKHFRENSYGKIVQLSGGGATNPLPQLSAYAASKAAVIRFAETLAEEVREDGIDVNAIAPGVLNTRLLDEFLAKSQRKAGHTLYESLLQQKEKGGTQLEKGADLAVFLASAESDGITGKLLSAVWDPWEELPLRLEDLRKTDIFTLRRIIPKDRGFNWGDR